MIPLAMFATTFLALLAGYPVALTLAGVALLFAFGGVLTGAFSPTDLGFLPNRLFGIMTNQTMLAVPLFVLMGVVLEKTRIAESLLESMSALLAGNRSGLAVSVILVGMLMAASTGIVGATVVTMGLMALPAMLKQGYDPRLATGTIAATGTLGQIIPPSIALVLLGDVLGNAYQQAQLEAGVFAPDTVSVGDLFAGALFPGLLLVLFYLTYVLTRTGLGRPAQTAASPELSEISNADVTPSSGRLLKDLVGPLLLIVLVLGSILGGLATPTEAAGVGAVGALLLGSLRNGTDRLSLARLREASRQTLGTTSMVFFILIGASLFSLVFRGYGGDELVQGLFEQMPGGTWGALAVVMIVIFLLGFMLDFIEITFVVVPIVGPILLGMGIDPIWLGVLIAVNLQTSFLTPPFGFALFYLRGVTPAHIPTGDIYRGVVPFVFLQLLLLATLLLWPALATWLPERLYG
ncbi:MAG: TRAP transporter large permease subunit [Gammaproteobacteria bacterium]|jgi:tripartite ATP-independent transporter DctM subunit|nr:MAG: TRAP transporter large permease subunit [Gammaproteobacteria bacterium]